MNTSKLVIVILIHFQAVIVLFRPNMDLKMEINLKPQVTLKPQTGTKKLKDLVKSPHANRGKSNQRGKLKELLPKIKNNVRFSEPKSNYEPYSFQSYKEKYGKRVKPLGGIGPNLYNEEWKIAMNKKRRMNKISKSIDFMNKRKYPGLSSEEAYKKYKNNRQSETSNSVYSIKYNHNEYSLKKIESKMRREKAMSYAETIQKPASQS